MTRDDLVSSLKLFLANLDDEDEHLPEGGVAERILCHLRDQNLAVVPKLPQAETRAVGAGLIQSGESQGDRTITAGNVYETMVQREDLANRRVS